MDEIKSELTEFWEGLKSKEKRANESAKIAKQKGNMETAFYQEGKATAFRWIARDFEEEFL